MLIKLKIDHIQRLKNIIWIKAKFLIGQLSSAYEIHVLMALMAIYKAITLGTFVSYLLTRLYIDFESH